MLYPFFGTMLGWLGVALTGSDTSSNVLFGSLQRITAEQLGLNPVLMAAANSSGGVMGKMIDAQSIVVASTATRWYGHEGEILRYVFWHSLVLAALVGGLVLLQAYVWPFTHTGLVMVGRGVPTAPLWMTAGSDSRPYRRRTMGASARRPYRRRDRIRRVSTLPTTPRLLLGPGPSPVLPRVLQAMTAPQRSHLDPDMMALLDDIRRRLHGLFHVSDQGIALAVSGTGSAGLETAVANVVSPGDRVLCIVTGYFGDRLAQVCERYDAQVTRLTGEWGRAIDPEQVRTALQHAPFKVVTVVHAETSTGVLQPVQGGRGPRARARRQGHRRRRDVAGRAPGGRRRLGSRRRLQLQPEGPWRAVGLRADRLHGRGTRRARRAAASTSTCHCSRGTGSSAGTTTPSPRRSSTPCTRRSA